MSSDFDRPGGSTLATALLVGIAGVAGSYATSGYTPSFVAAPITSFLTRAMPDAILRFAIVTLTDVGQQFGIEHLGQRANLLFALTLGTVLFAVLALPVLVLARRLDRPVEAIGVVGVFVWLATAVLTGAPLIAVGAGIGSAVVAAAWVLVAATSGSSEPSGQSMDVERRALLGSLAGTLGVGVLGYLLGRRRTGGAGPASGPSPVTNGSVNAEGDSAKQLLDEAEQKSLDVQGLEALVSGEDFYEVDIQNINPDLQVADWTLSVTGAVENERTYGYDDLTSMEGEHRFMTLRCVSDPLNGKKMDNALWTGVPMERLLEGTNPQGDYVMLRSSDGYYEEFPVEALRSGMVAYGKDGGTLPRQHGYPARALIPGHWGEINVKWLTEIEILDRSAKGFWEKRGWHGTGPVNTVAKLHATNHHDDGRVTVGGHANAGTRGIERVEVSIDGGETWNEARLSEPLTDVDSDEDGSLWEEDVWRQWAYTYDPPDGKHEVVVRAVDGTGTVQPRTDEGPYPSGASGWVSKMVEP